jgi:hypothetical protein
VARWILGSYSSAVSEPQAGTTSIDVAVDIGLLGAVVVVQVGLERRLSLAFEAGLVQILLTLVQRPLDAELPFQDPLVVGHRGPELLLGPELVAAANGVERRGAAAGDAVAEPGQLVLVGLVGAVPVLLVAGFGALQLGAGVSPHARSAELLLEFGGGAGKLGGLGVQPLGEGLVGSGLGLELLASSGLPPVCTFGLELLVGRAFGRFPGLGAELLPAAFDLLDCALAFRVDPQLM